MSLDTDYIFFDIRDFTGVSSTSSYALDICPLTFIPKIYTDRYSDERILWDFGDGTTSTSLCASHSYTFPGKYEVKLYVYKGEGQAVISTYTTTVNIFNFITDTISLTSKSSYVREAGTIGHEDGITVIRYNSWQSFDALSGKNYTINLFASGAGGKFIEIDDYNSSKYSHLEPSYSFYRKDIIPNKGYSFTPIDSIQTDSNALLYAKIDNNNIVLCDPGEEGSSFVGTRGTATIYFAADNYNIEDVWFKDRQPVLIFAGFDTSNFDDFVSYNKGYREIIKNNRFSYLNNITTNLGFSITPQLSVSNLTFSSNGIDGIGGDISNFNIKPIQYGGTKIPVVIRAKNEKGYPAKYLPLLSATDTPQIDFEFKLLALSGDGDAISPVVQPAITTEYVASNNAGGYWKGFLEFDNDYLKNNTLENIYLSAYTTYTDNFNFIKYPTPVGVIIAPANQTLQRLNLIKSYKNSSSSLDLDIDSILPIYSNTPSSTGLNCIQIIPESRDDSGSYFSFWASDNQDSKLVKYDTFGAVLSTIDIESAILSSGEVLSLSNPGAHSVAADGDLNIWTSLYNSVSSFKINNQTGRVDYVATPNLVNSTYAISNDHLGFITLSAFIGKNTVLPGSLDTDRDNNIWIAYENPLSAYLFKYSTEGEILSSVPLTAGYSPFDIAVDTDGDVWCVARQYLTTNTDISGFNDIIVYHDNALGVTTSMVETSGRASNITIDTDNNAYAAVGDSTVIKINKNDLSISEINIQGTLKQGVLGEPNLKGIAGTASKDVVVLNNVSKTISVIDTVSDENVNNLHLEIDDEINARGDWTGIKWVAKYSPRTFTINVTLTGVSDLFTVVRAEDPYRISKFGEGFDATQLYKDLRYQEALLYHNNMFDGFIGTIVGNISSSPNTLGKRLYEKAENFVSNIIDPDTCEIDALYSLCKMYDVGVDQFDRVKFATPASIRRVINLLSIKQSKLKGSRNKYNRDFKINGYNPGNNDFFGKNLGPEISILTTILTAGSASMPIVAQSKFSNDYIYINTDILSSQYIEYIPGTETYHMSGFNANWGWPLVLPDNSTYEDLQQHYRFFNYTIGEENSQKEGIIEWDSQLTTLSENIEDYKWQGEESVIEEIIRFALMDGLDVFDSSTS